MDTDRQGAYILLISIHGLIRGHELELGRDADTGGQCKYVLELMHALEERPEIERVDLLTRKVVDPELSAEYAQSVEVLSDAARIVRLEAGPEGYLRKEDLWDHLDNFVDNALTYLHESGRIPDIIHSHYADGGYVASRLANHLGVPLVHTGHSLGRVKRRRLLATGMKRDEIESRYHMGRRTHAEEDTLAAADVVITSTHNEIEEQYGLYDHYQPQRMVVIPPGTDLKRFQPPRGDERETSIARGLARFLEDPEKQMILALSRPDERKNIRTLIEAYGESPELQRISNLVIVAGNREDIREMESGPRFVLTDILLTIDHYDLHGKVAYPKHHQADDVPLLYRLAAASRGVFVNPALTEPFGLTLLEAAASGLPVVATEDGGPSDIIGHCNNGLLIDPLDKKAMAATMLTILKDDAGWEQMSRNGLKGVQAHYSWQAHAATYISTIHPLLERRTPLPRARVRRRQMLYHDRAVFTDLDQNLLGDTESLAEFIDFVRRNRKCANFGIATGRRLESALKIMKRYGIPQPDVLITSVGTEIYYAPELTADTAWPRHIDHLWTPGMVRQVLSDIEGLKLQPKSEQSRFKISYYYDRRKAPGLEEIQTLLHQADQTVNAYISFGQYLDIIPIRASKGFALRYFAHQHDIPLEHILAAGGSGTDEDMMRGNTLAVVVANRHDEELSHLADVGPIYFARSAYARGILEAIDHYDFYGECRLPDEAEAEG
jgi:sucrose-phosphate synthase